MLRLIAVLCLAIVACNPPALRELVPPPVRVPDRIAYVDPLGDLWTVRPDGSSRVRLTSLGEPEDSERRTVHLWPAWSPDGRTIAAARGHVVGSDLAGADLYTFDASTGTTQQVYSRAKEVPFFYGWSPDGRWLAYLVQTDMDISLRTSLEDGQRGRRLDGGRTVYFAWSPKGEELLAHVGPSSDSGQSHLKLFRPTLLTSRPRTLPLTPNHFRAPVYSPDGRLVLVGSEDGVWTLGANSALARQIAAGSERPAFVMSPQGDRVAISHASHDLDGLRRGFDVVDLETGESTRVFERPILGLFWSPDGRQIAWAEAETDSRGLTWWVGDGRGARRRIAQFYPTPMFASTIAYFDQYVASTSVWSPSSDAIAFAGWLRFPTGPSKIWVVPARPGVSPRAIAEGTVLSWSPAPPYPLRRQPPG